MLDFNKFPPREPGDAVLSSLGKHLIKRAYSSQWTVADRSGLVTAYAHSVGTGLINAMEKAERPIVDKIAVREMAAPILDEVRQVCDGTTGATGDVFSAGFEELLDIAFH